MKWEKNELAILGVFNYYEPGKLLYRVLSDYNKISDMPWPLLFSNGLFHKVLRFGKQVSQKDCINDNQLFMTHSLWTCDCDPDEGHTIIHVSPANACIDCRRSVRNFDQKIKYWHEELRYEPKPYEYSEEEGKKLSEEYFNFMEGISTKRGFLRRFFGSWCAMR